MPPGCSAWPPQRAAGSRGRKRGARPESQLGVDSCVDPDVRKGAAPKPGQDCSGPARKNQGRWTTLRATCWAVASGTSPSTVTTYSPTGRTKKLVVPFSLETSAVRAGGALGSTKTDRLARPSL